ncbi:MAG: FecR domain-containing protein [Saprospiraceae bacterium]|nr:FecR domain-containing protein [Saprospiraceae bacterium]
MNRLEEKILQYIISGRAAEDDAIDREIREDPSFDQSDFDLLNKIWTGADNLKDYRRLPHDTAWQNIVNETGVEAEVRKMSSTQSWLIAASMIGLVVFGAYFLLQNPYVTHHAVVAENYILPDNTTVALSEGTTIRHLKPEQFLQSPQRDVFMEGEGTFEVMPDSLRPFTVITDLTSVNVLGTRFIYRATGDYSESENLEGQVRFATNDGTNEVVLNPGDKASYDGTNWEVDRFEPPPPPAPPVEPTNNISIGDLIEILGDRNEMELELMPSVDYSDVVVPVNLNVIDADSLIMDLRDNPLITIEVIPTNFGYKITTLRGQPSGLTADYTFDMYRAGVPPNQ